MTNKFVDVLPAVLFAAGSLLFLAGNVIAILRSFK